MRTTVPGLPKPYKIKIKKHKPPLTGAVKPKVATEKEQLLGTVRGMPASDIEERFAKSLDKRNVTYWFRLPIGAPRGMPGFNELDFLIMAGGYYPVQIDGEFSHAGKEAKDILTDARIMEGLKEYSPFPVLHITYMKLGNQKAAEGAVRELLG